MGRKRTTLVLLDEEIKLIKGLQKHTDFNVQMIVSLFSHLSRNINTREIGAIRAGKGKYDAIPAASKSDVEKFLAHYKRFELQAQAYGLIPRQAHFQLIQKAQEAMRSAVMIYNNPNINWKTEIFIVNAVIAWTYLMHAYFLKNGTEYIYKSGGKPVLTDDGQPKHWELTKCIKVSECPLSKPVKANLEYIIAIRNEIEHRLSDNVDKFLEPKLQACAVNFNVWLCKLFGDECGIAHELAFAIQFSEFSLEKHHSVTGSTDLPNVIKVVNALVEKDLSEKDFSDPAYSYRVYVVPRTINNKNKADQAVTYAAAGSEVELAVRETERPKYTATQIVAQMKSEGFSDFNVHGKQGFVQFWKSLEAKKPGKGYGVEVADKWFWYDSMMNAVREHLTTRAAQSSA